MSNSNQHVVTVSADLKPLIPKFLKSQKLDIDKLVSFIERKDVASIASIAHKIKGNAGSFGFDDFGRLAQQLEREAKTDHFDKMQELIFAMRDYLDNLKILFTDDEQSA